MDHDQCSTECVGHVSVVLFCSIVVCVWLWCGPYGQFWGSILFLFIIACFIFVFSRSSSGDAKGLLGTFSRCDHIDRVQVKGHGGVSSTFKIKPGFQPRVGPLVGKFSAHTRIYTAGNCKLGLDVTSVPGSSLQLSYIKWQMADVNSATCTTACICI